MKLKWYGHASFRLTRDDGVSVITDPYDPATSGYAAYTEPCDIVIVSSDNDSFHCNTQLIPGDHLTINALELARSGQPRTEKGVQFTAIQAMEALNHREHAPDQNGMYRFDMDGISIGHLGDVGNALSEAQLEFFKGVDVLLALVGGHPTLELEDLQVALSRIAPKLIVPMHYRTLTFKLRNLFWIERFLSDYPESMIDIASACEVKLHRTDLPPEPRVLILDYQR